MWLLKIKDIKHADFGMERLFPNVITLQDFCDVHKVYSYSVRYINVITKVIGK